MLPKMLHNLRDNESPGVCALARFAPPNLHRSAPPVNVEDESRVCILPYAFCAYGRLPAISLIKAFRGSSKCTLWVAFSAHSAASPSCIWPSTCAFVHQIFSSVGRMYTWAGRPTRTSPFGRRLARTRQLVDRAASLGRPPLGRATHSDAPLGRAPRSDAPRWAGRPTRTLELDRTGNPQATNPAAMKHLGEHVSRNGSQIEHGLPTQAHPTTSPRPPAPKY